MAGHLCGCPGPCPEILTGQRTMIEINLLPDNMRKEKRTPFKFDLELNRVYFLAGGLVAAVLIVSLLFLSMGTFVRKKQILKLVREEQGFAVEKQEVEIIDREISLLKAKMGALDQVVKRKILWAKKLNEISDLMLPGIWLSRIRTDEEGNFMIEGSVISRKEEAMASVGKFMKNLREDPSFFQDFSDIKLESVQRDSVKEQDIVDFKIALYFNGQ